MMRQAVALLITLSATGICKSVIAQERPRFGMAPGMSIVGSGASLVGRTRPESAPRSHAIRQFPSPDQGFIVYEGKAVDGYHDTLWLSDKGAHSPEDLLAPEDARWPGSGATTFLEWLDNDRFVFIKHCGTGCTSLEVINVRTHTHDYFCTDGTFYLSPDKHYAVGQSVEADDSDLTLLEIDHDGRPSRQEDCAATIRGYGYCPPDEPPGTQLDWLTFGHWAADSRSFTYTSTALCPNGSRHRTRRHTFILK